MISGLIYLWIVIVFIIDCTDFIDTIKRQIGIWLDIKVGRMKPLDCSLCMTFWCGIIYLLCTHSFSLGTLALVCGMAYLAQTLASVLHLVKDTLELGIGKLQKQIDKLWEN